MKTKGSKEYDIPAETAIGNYKLQQTIGIGSFGKVKLAIHTSTQQQVALKFTSKDKITHMDMIPRIKREIQYLSCLRHPHIIKLYQVITTPTDIIMVLEYAPTELFDYIVTKGRLQEPEARKLFQQLVSAVSHCHRHKIVHRDLKPENVLLDQNYNVKIADFGLSNIMTDGDFLKTSCGSPNYASPEVISGKLYCGPEVDVWSCGVILYVMLCGKLPFDDENIPLLFKKISGGVFSVPPFITLDARDLLIKMLTVDPMKRITILEIQKSRWFDREVPNYLLPLPILSHSTLEINSSIVDELVKKMGFTRLAIENALKTPDSENNQVKVAYQLLVDHRMFLKDQEKWNNMQEFFSSSPPPWNSSLLLNGTKSRPIIAPGSYSPSIHPLSSSLSVIKKDFFPHSVSKKKPRNKHKWYYGIRSASSPLDIMLEIYLALQKINVEWKIISTYHLHCRTPLKKTPKEYLKFEIRLYQIQEGIGNYLVDFKNSSKRMNTGSSPELESDVDSVDYSNLGVFSFLNVCGSLIRELARG